MSNRPSFSPPLPIDAVLAQLQGALAAAGSCVLQAPPGSGKTTRVPLALLDQGWLNGGAILLLEPRRLAAINAARYLARQLGEEVGATVGYTIRHESRLSAATRIEVVTEGILTRRLQADPELRGVGLVILDEFHERNLNSDLALALCRDVQLGLRDDLRLLAMSATLDCAPLSRLLGDCPVVTAEGFLHPVEIRHIGSTPPLRELTTAVAAVTRRALAETTGDTLVFLPGVGDIERCRQLLSGLPDGVELCPLYADLPLREQERAIVPLAGRRKVVLATNIAETSLTIEGVRAVVDSGFERRPRFDAGRGMSQLETLRISLASARQRSGRAGRVAPGIAYRLWSPGEEGAMIPFAPPEIRTADLAPLALELARWGVADAATLCWLDPPPAGHLAGARQLLQLLSALDGQLRITALGERMASFPLHPRLARLLVAAAERGQGALGTDLAALLSERDLLGRSARQREGVDCDLSERLELLDRWRRRGRPESAEAAACRAIERTACQLRSLLKVRADDRPDEVTALAMAHLLAPAWPDRVGREREGTRGRYLLANGVGARLSRRSAVTPRSWLVALELKSGGTGEGEIDLASAFEDGVAEEVLGPQMAWQREVLWDERAERVVAREVRRLGAIVVAERPTTANGAEVERALLQGLQRLGPQVLGWSSGARQLAARVRTLAQALPEQGWPDFSVEGLWQELDWLLPFLAGCRSRSELERFDLLAALQARLGRAALLQLDRLAPETLTVPSGSTVRLDYDVDGPPLLEVKLQELFGLAETPRIADGRLAVKLHLLSPARRPIAVTQDLRSFWNQVYPEVKRELKGRYPKHPWPDDPWSAVPTRHTSKRQGAGGTKF